MRSGGDLLQLAEQLQRSAYTCLALWVPPWRSSELIGEFGLGKRIGKLQRNGEWVGRVLQK